MLGTCQDSGQVWACLGAFRTGDGRNEVAWSGRGTTLEPAVRELSDPAPELPDPLLDTDLNCTGHFGCILDSIMLALLRSILCAMRIWLVAVVPFW